VFDLLQKHVLKRIDLTKAEFQQATTFFIPKRVRKHQYLLEAGDVSRHVAYVVKGCLRSYTIDEAGEEHIGHFAIEDWWIGDLYSFYENQPSVYAIDALEDSELLLLDRSGMEKLCLAIPKFERYFRLILQGSFVASQRRIMQSLSATAEERYLQFLKNYPAIFSRVPQKMIASYLGITPQSLSRIRRHLAG
jgi:CRP-like cAMP-binding protein